MAVDVIYWDAWMLNWLAFPNGFSPTVFGHAYKCTDPNKTDCGSDISYPWSFEGVIYFARVLEGRTTLLYNTIGTYIVPALYSMLGACAFALRSLSGSPAAPASPSPADRSRVRLLLAVLVGVIVGVGLFSDFTKGFNLPALAIAFLAGYAVETFFSFLDAIVEATRHK